MGLLAAVPVAGLKFSASYYLGLAILAALMVVALVKAYRMWEEIHDVEEPDSPADLLAAFDEARVAVLDDLEFERVRRRLVGPTTGQGEKSASPDRDAKGPDGS